MIASLPTLAETPTRNLSWDEDSWFKPTQAVHLTTYYLFHPWVLSYFVSRFPLLRWTERNGVCVSSAAGALSTKVGREPQGPALFPSSQQEVRSHSLGHEVLSYHWSGLLCCWECSLSQTARGFLGLAAMVINLRAETGQFKDSLLGQN